ncbi:MAG: endonuclease III domain-containing protein [Deltaproteobacteria bacterium]|nr:endonuclease III domain-containing protein [Deltaproteobacteria bacterium]MBW2343520.1 endonuclease III domain-containing protein [Deltaproteobacteria bacterium]
MKEKRTTRDQEAVPRTLTGQKLMDMFDLLFAHFGPQDWWPAETDLEMMVGAVLTQNTNWKNVERAIENLKSKHLLTVNALCSMSIDALAQEIRPAGYYNIKARRLMNLIHFMNDQYGEDLSEFFRDETQIIREGLLSVNGVGPETADSILLYAARRPVFVIDAYTHRILKRHGMSEEYATYYELQELFMDHLPEDQELYSEFHALIVQTGKNYCKRKPLCLYCPLEKWEREF